MINTKQNLKLASDGWDSAMPTFLKYLKIPNKSPAFDKDWRKTRHIDEAARLLLTWVKARKIKGLKSEVIRIGGRTPLIYVEVLASGTSKETVLLYGHMDKQPECTGWLPGLSAWKPVFRGDKLYARGAADDGYSTFAALMAIENLQAQGLPHARIVVLIEAGEESGSPDLEFYVKKLAKRIGTLSLVVCLDSGAGDYKRLWLTNSLRGLVGGTLRVSLLKEGVHSGAGTGIAASSFRIARMLISRIEDERTGAIKLKSFNPAISANVKREVARSARLVGDIKGKLPFLLGVEALSKNQSELLLAGTWKPTLAVTGADGFPAVADAGNVLRKETALKLSLRLPPNGNAIQAMNELKKVLLVNPPYKAKVSFENIDFADGWSAPELAPWLTKSVREVSHQYFGNDFAQMGEGGSIPFMAMLGKKFPKAQFVVTGVLGPESNAHGPNEFLHLPFTKKLTAGICIILNVVPVNMGLAPKNISRNLILLGK